VPVHESIAGRRWISEVAEAVEREKHGERGRNPINFGIAVCNIVQAMYMRSYGETEERMHDLRAIYVNFWNFNRYGNQPFSADNSFAPLNKLKIILNHASTSNFRPMESSVLRSEGRHWARSPRT
jgi:hypothetical protein